MKVYDIHLDEIQPNYGFHIGDTDAPVKVIEFINLRCPDCKEWFEKSESLLGKYVEEGKIERIIKHFDKEKPELQKGNTMHRYLPYDDETKALEEMKYLFQHQDEWGSLDPSDVGEYARDERNLTLENNNYMANYILEEVKNANVEYVPTVIIGEHVLNETVSRQDLEKIVDKEVSKETQ